MNWKKPLWIVAIVVVAALLGYLIPKLWILWGALGAGAIKAIPKEEPPYDDTPSIKVEQNAADSDVDRRAALRRAKAIRAKLRERADLDEEIFGGTLRDD